MKDHGTLPERSYENNNGKDLLVTEEKETKTSVLPDLTSSAKEPSADQLPREDANEELPENPIQEERKD